MSMFLFHYLLRKRFACSHRPSAIDGCNTVDTELPYSRTQAQENKDSMRDEDVTTIGFPQHNGDNQNSHPVDTNSDDRLPDTER